MARGKGMQRNAKAWRAAGETGNVKVLLRISPEQHRALQDEALKRATAAGSLRPDASAVLREVLCAWLERRKQEPRARSPR